MSNNKLRNGTGTVGGVAQPEISDNVVYMYDLQTGMINVLLLK